jgi:hypothetical protein
MIRGHGYPNAAGWDEETEEIDASVGLDTADPAPNDTLMSELARLEGPPGSVDDVADTT